MAFKTGFLLLLLGIFGIFEVQAASIPTENDMWMDIDEDGDKRNVEVDNTDTARYLPTDDLTYEDLASDVADGFDYYKDAIESRAVACQDAFGAVRSSVNDVVTGTLGYISSQLDTYLTFLF
ncbi:hypothetical protein ACROYT_G009264 [Oculina patagonica]